MAPVGHARAHSSQSVQRGKSMTGNPKEGRTSNGRDSVMTPVLMLSTMILNIRGPYRSFPEYERLKLLLITGKSGMMLPGTACVSPGQFRKLGSVIFTRVN